MSLASALAVATFGPAGCASPEAEVAIPADTVSGWMAELARHPERFAEVTGGEQRDGWVALHSHRYEAAWQAFEGTGAPTAQARAALDLEVLYTDLDRMSAHAWRRFLDAWSARDQLPPDSAARSVGALSAWCHGGSTEPWGADLAPDATGAVAVAHLTAGGSLTDVTGEGPVETRLRLHAGARAQQPEALEQLGRAALEPLVVEQADGFARTFYDPCLYATQAAVWRARATASLQGADWRALASAAAGDDIRHHLFAAWQTPADLRSGVQAPSAGLIGAHVELAASAGLGPLTAEDDRQLAREEARALDAGLADWHDRVGESGTKAGRALLDELALLQRLRQHLLVARARLALDAGHERQALAYLEHGYDAASRGVGPSNSPAQLALLGEARLRLGHTREALDALQILVEARPDVVGITETVSALAALEGLARRGDSKEH